MSAGASLQENRLALGRGSTAICLPVTTTPDLLYRCLHAVLAHTPRQVPVLVVEAGDGDPAVARFLSSLDADLHHIRLPDSAGPVGLTNAAVAAAGEADIVLLPSHAVVYGGWLERMLAAGRSDTTVGTASALGNNAGLLSVGGPREPLGADVSPERLAAEVAEHSPRAYPRVPMADGHCVWISRAALELAGALDTEFRSLRAAVTDFSQRGLLHGLVNVAADDVFVASVHPSASATGGALDVGEDRALLLRRYPYLRQAAGADVSAPLRQSISVARRAVRGLSVTVDARILRGTSSGVHAQAVELIETLARTERVETRVLLDPAVAPDVIAVLDRLPHVQRLYAGEVDRSTPRSDIVHRPHQVTSPADLELLPRLGERLVITHLDLIAFHNPGYFASFNRWEQYRRVTRQALAMADQAIFLSAHARADAVREGLVAEHRAQVVPMAVRRDKAPVAQRRPADAPDGPFLLSIGNDFRHKNRVFAIKLLEELRRRGWDGSLVLAGANVGRGSSRGEEAAYLALRPDLAQAVRDLPAVGEPEKEWLYANATAVVYPTTYEGFGLIPFEAAALGTPCLFAPQASLADLLPADAAVLVPWDPAESAARALALLEDEQERRRHLELIEAAARASSDWDSIGRALLGIYEEAVRLPYREAALLAGEGSVREAQLSKWVDLGVEMDGDLIGEDAQLPRDVQRALLALATRRRLRGPLFALLRSLYEVGYRARRSRSG